MRIRSTVFWRLLAWAFLLPAADPQAPTIRTDVNLVQLSAIVKDTQGQTVLGLPKDAFQLTVDGSPQAITVFQGEDAPVAAGIVVDNSASMARRRTETIAGAMAFARASNPKDQMFVVHFSDRARFGLADATAFARSTSELEAAVSRFELGGTTALYDAIITAYPQFIRSYHGRKVLLVITDGEDNSSKSAVPDILQAALRSGVSIFIIGMFDGENDAKNREVLRDVAKTTGGAAFFPTAAGEVTRICERIARDVRAQYTIGFPGAEDGRYHEIKLTAKHPMYDALEVHTRAGYVAVKP